MLTSLAYYKCVCVCVCVCQLTFRLSMNTGDVPATVTIESVNSVTFTQDTDGNIILHCPQNGKTDL